MSTVIKVENLSKQYRLGDVGTGTLSHDLKRWWYQVRGKEDPYLRIGETNDRSKKGESDYVWALKDINFEVKSGEVLGIIGRNGAGKSTLLKILSKTTKPTTGSIKVKGRIASLLEVGTGFHPELTGRENIYLNGAILGMTRREIQSKFDEIVDFSGVERYIDTPVKRYSSGMYVRLAFAVAAHLEPEILIVDEVLAVGDAEFQKKCLGKMKDVSANDGRTVLFVSHNMGAIKKICNSALLLENGTIGFTGDMTAVLEKYINPERIFTQSVFSLDTSGNFNSDFGYAYQLQIENLQGELINEIQPGQKWQIRVLFRLSRAACHFVIALGISNEFDGFIRTAWSNNMDLESGEYEAVFKEDLLFASGEYNISIGLSVQEKSIQYLEKVATIRISNIADLNLDKSILRTSGCGVILNPMAISIKQTINR